MVRGSLIHRWKEMAGARRLVRTLRGLGVDLSSGDPDQAPELWVKEILEEAARVSDEEYSSNLLKSEAQIAALQSQINPHFLYNTLETIRGQALIQGADEIADMTEILSNMFRYNVNQSDKLATWEQEMENVRNYFRIQRYRFQDRFILQELFDAEDEELRRCRIPRLSLQPIVENAVFHGLEPKIGKGTVQIRVFLTKERLVIRVADDGVGMNAETAEKLRTALSGKGFDPKETGGRRVAMVNIQRRLQLYYGEEYGLTFSSAENSGTIFEMTVPRDVEVK